MFSSNSHGKERMRIKTKTTIVCLQSVSSRRQNAFSLVTTHLVLSNAALIHSEVRCPELRRKPCVFGDRMERFSVSENISNTAQKMREGKQMPLEDFMPLLPTKANSTWKSIPISAEPYNMCSGFFYGSTAVFNRLFHDSEGLFLKGLFFQGDNYFLWPSEFLDEDSFQVGEW